MTTRTIILLLLGCLTSALLGVFAGVRLLAPPAPTTEMMVVEPDLEDLRLRTFRSSVPTDFTTAAAGVTPAVVFIRTYFGASRLAPNQESTSTGSGVIIGADGLIATNNHVVDGARRIRVTLSDRSEYDATVVGTDEATDLALLRVDRSGLPVLTFGNSDSLRVGEWVLAVGNPFSLNSTVTAGIVSAKGRSIDVLQPEDRIESFIQTDAAVNPGNSGGALVNTNGELVGINTAILTNSGRHEGFAFAIPGNLANRVLSDLREFGEVKRALLGARIQSVNDAQAKQLGLEHARGVIITDLNRSGSAIRAGLEVGDVITGMNGIAVGTSPALQEQLSRYRPGQKIRVTYIRNGRKRNATVLLRDKRNGTRTLVSERSDDLLHRLGFEVRGLSPAELQDHPDGGVRVVSIFRDSPVEATNMNAGFLITHVNGERVGELTDFLKRVRTEGKLLFTGRYDGYQGDYFYEIDG